MWSLRRVLASLAVTAALSVFPMAALAIDCDGDLGSLKYQAKMPVDGVLATVVSGSLGQNNSPNTSLSLLDNGPDSNITAISIDMEQEVFLELGGNMLLQGNRSAGQIVSSGVGVILVDGNIAYNSATGEFSTPVVTLAGKIPKNPQKHVVLPPLPVQLANTGRAIIFVFTTDIKSVVRPDGDTGTINSGVAKVKIYPGQAELVTVDTGGGPVPVSSVRGTGEPVFLKIKLPALKFWEVVV